jgi:putrescine transport system ATP-binding protein
MSHPLQPAQAPLYAPAIQLEGVTKRFGPMVAVNGIDLTVAQGEFFSLLGASGCGKTTLLRLIAGLEYADEGRILIDGRDMAAVPAYRRPVNTVFQSYALFPHMTVAANIAFGLRQENLPRAEIEDRIKEGLRLVALEGMERRRPHELSGGQRQRVALCRALVKRPKILLLDEPMAALDRRLREQTRFELMNIQHRLGITFVMVTHDQEEAMGMSHRIAVMNNGRIVQVDSPRKLYEQPVDRFVAGFVGDANFLPATVVAANGERLALKTDDGLPLNMNGPGGLPGGTAVTVMLRPERIQLSTERADIANAVRGTIENIAYLGGSSIVQVSLPGGRAIVARLGGAPGVTVAAGSAVWALWPEDAGVVLTR